MDVTFSHFCRILKRQRARGKVAGIGVFLVTLKVEAFEVVVADDSLAAHDKVAACLDALWYAIDGFGQVGDVGADVTIAPCDNLRQPSIVVGDDERQSVKLP